MFNALSPELTLKNEATTMDANTIGIVVEIYTSSYFANIHDIVPLLVSVF